MRLCTDFLARTSVKAPVLAMTHVLKRLIQPSWNSARQRPLSSWCIDWIRQSRSVSER